MRNVAVLLFVQVVQTYWDMFIVKLVRLLGKIR